MKKQGILIVVLLLTVTLFYSVKAQTDSIKNPFDVKPKVEPLVIISGIENGSYFQFATEIAKIEDIPIIIRTSKGSVDNYNILMTDPTADIVFMQFDILQRAKMFDITSGTKNTENIKLLLPLANEEIHLMTKLNSKILGIQDLKGKKVAIGISSVQGTPNTTGLIKSICGINWQDVEISFDSAFVSLLGDKIDALFFVGYVPVKKFQDLLPTFNQMIRLVPIKDDRLTQFHVKATIPAGSYPWLPYDVETFAVRSVLVTNTKFESPADAQRIEKFLTAIKENIGELQKTGSPKWKEVKFDFKSINWEVHPAAKNVFGL